MKIAIILNGISRKKKKFYKEIYPSLTDHFVVEVLETRYAGHAEKLAATALNQKIDCILAAGGDGTLNQVINGLLKNEGSNLPTIGLIPLGSGNDFARTCSLQPEAKQLIQLLKAGPTPTDIGKIECIYNGEKITHYFINECSLGMGPEVVKRLSKNAKRWGPDLSYLISIVSTFISHQPQEVLCKANAWTWKGKARVIAIANGKSFGNAIYIAPDANPGDGVFNSFIAGDVPLWKFLLFLQTLKKKRKINDPLLHYNTLTRVELSSEEECAIEAEGELVGLLPATITVLMGKISFFR